MSHILVPYVPAAVLPCHENYPKTLQIILCDIIILNVQCIKYTMQQLLYYYNVVMSCVRFVKVSGKIDDVLVGCDRRYCHRMQAWEIFLSLKDRKKSLRHFLYSSYRICIYSSISFIVCNKHIIVYNIDTKQIVCAIQVYYHYIVIVL